jgi:hypothetical protein
MSLPYPAPEPIKTKRRCQFSMPGRKYDCRAIGKFLLDGKDYCAAHYDTAWKVANPVYGQQHEWHFHVNHLNGNVDPYPSCRRCGSVKQHEGLPQFPCRGSFGQITLR